VLCEEGYRDPARPDEIQPIELLRVVHDKEALEPFLEFVFELVRKDKTFPSNARLILDWKREGAYKMDARGLEYLCDNRICEADLGVPYWIRYVCPASAFRC
jgi:hypothetical protein